MTRTKARSGPEGIEEVDEKDRLLAALKKAKGNRSLAAKQLGIRRATLYRRFRELGIESSELGSWAEKGFRRMAEPLFY